MVLTDAERREMMAIEADLIQIMQQADRLIHDLVVLKWAVWGTWRRPVSF